MTVQLHIGQCYCKAIRYEVDGPLRNVVACHCNQCQNLTGSYVMASATYKKNLKIIDATNALTWFQSSENARRGFCRCCGSQLFWESEESDTISVMAGSLITPSELIEAEHLYAHNIPNYYRIHSDADISMDNTVSSIPQKIKG